jgi:Peptidase inhibitor I9
MSDKKKTDGGWSKDEVVARVREQSKSGKTPSVQVFLAPDIAGEDADAAYRSLKEQAMPAVKSPDHPVVGQYRKLSRSFSVQADPDTIEKISRNPNVSAILPSEVEDILPKPKDVKREPSR